MKIDPRIPLTGELQTDQAKNAKKPAAPSSGAKSDSAASVHTGDTIQISGQHAQVQHLAAQVEKVPEVRAERVAPLKTAVQKKTYRPDSGKVADAMLAEHSRKSAKS